MNPTSLVSALKSSGGYVRISREVTVSLCLTNITIDSNLYSLINMYAPNDRHAREMFFRKLKELIDNKAQCMNIYGGDMNET